MPGVKFNSKNGQFCYLKATVIVIIVALPLSNYSLVTTLCNSGETIYMSYKGPIVTLPCTTKYSEDSLENDTLQLYQGNDTNLQLINESDSRFISYKPGIGFEYDISQDSHNSRIYKCVFLSNVEDYIILNLTQSIPDFVDITVSDNIDNCHHNYTLDDQANFTCSAVKSDFQKEFRWFYKTTDLQEIPVRGPYHGGSDIGDKITSTAILPFKEYPNITQIICKVQKKNSTEWSQNHFKIHINDKVSVKPEILDLYLDHGRKLVCKYRIYSREDNEWLQDGEPLSGLKPELHHDSNYVVWSSITIPPTDERKNNYTCVVNGSISKSIVIEKPSTNLVLYLVYITLPIVLSILLGSSVVAATFIYKNLQNKNKYRQLLLHGDSKSAYSYESTSSPSSELCWDMFSPLQPLESTGAHGLIYKAHLLEDGRKIVFKTFKYPTVGNEVTASLTFWIFLKEIKIMQYLENHPYIVKFEGVLMQASLEFKVFLGLEYCPWQLKKLMETCRTESFENDIVSGQYIYRISVDSPRYPNVLRTSNLMKWAEQIAEALAYLVSKGLVHRDIAARNILLTWLYNGCEASMDNLKVQLADFGHARDIREGNDPNNIIPYITRYDNGWERRELNLPVTRYPIEALENIGYTHKSDVYSYGCLLWEMFTLAVEEPYSCIPKTDFTSYNRALADHLRIGNRPYRPDFVPPEIWDIMQTCWRNDPNERPTFAYIHDKLKAINYSYGIHIGPLDESYYSSPPQTAPYDQNANGQIQTRPRIPADYCQYLPIP